VEDRVAKVGIPHLGDRYERILEPAASASASICGSFSEKNCGRVGGRAWPAAFFPPSGFSGKRYGMKYPPAAIYSMSARIA
jgi:hypothetical protein